LATGRIKPADILDSVEETDASHDPAAD